VPKCLALTSPDEEEEFVSGTQHDRPAGGFYRAAYIPICASATFKRMSSGITRFSQAEEKGGIIVGAGKVY
jgi:hypothetical protein